MAEKLLDIWGDVNQGSQRLGLELWARGFGAQRSVAETRTNPAFERIKDIAMSRFGRKPASFSRAFGAPIADVTSIDLSREKHYSIAEVAKLWALSEKTIRRMFEHEPGVLCWGKSEARFRRGYRTLRIPETVMLRVHRQLRIAS